MAAGVLLWSTIGLCTTGQAADSPTSSLETVRGSACYRFGDNETPAIARRAATALAQEQAIRSHRVFVESSTRVKNFQLEDDLVQTASAAILQRIVIDQEERKNQEICVSLSAQLSPVSAEDLIRQRLQAKEISQTAQSALVPEQASFALTVSTNKADGRFIEGEKLIIYVKSERDAYLKLDYFQADGTVVHLVPNMYRGQAFIAAGKTYTFGDDAGPEHFIIKGPFGDETIKALVSVRPFELSTEPREAVSESAPYLRKLQNGLRGIKVVAAASAVSLSTESKAVADYKQRGTPSPLSSAPPR